MGEVCNPSALIAQRWNGNQGTEQLLQRGQTRFVVYVPPGEVGSLTLDLAGIDAQQCRVATGQLEHEVGYGLRPIYEVPVTLGTVSPPECTLTVRTTSGVVTADHLGVTCSAESSCTFLASARESTKAIFGSERLTIWASSGGVALMGTGTTT